MALALWYLVGRYPTPKEAFKLNSFVFGESHAWCAICYQDWRCSRWMQVLAANCFFQFPSYILSCTGPFPIIDSSDWVSEFSFHFQKSSRSLLITTIPYQPNPLCRYRLNTDIYPSRLDGRFILDIHLRNCIF